LRHLAAAEPENADYQRVVSIALHNLGDVLRLFGQDEQARELYQEGLGILQKLAADEPIRADYQGDLEAAVARLQAEEHEQHV
jgi:hypothetical protein